jgi:FkbM family methyltransferase
LLRDRIVHALIGTPVQGPIDHARWLVQRWRHPDLPEVNLERQRMAQLLDRVITDGMNCIDIGCHLGSMLHEIVRRSPHGRHVAVEPLPYKAKWIKRKYQNVRVFETAIGDTNGTVAMDWTPRRSGFSSLHVNKGADAAETVEVPINRLDDLVGEEERFGFIKIDVEGAELFVFQGARRVVATSRPVILFECTESAISRFDITAERVFDFVEREFDYQIYLLKDWLDGRAPLDLERFAVGMKYPFQAFNFVAAPRP